MSALLSPRNVVVAVLLLFLAFVPVYAAFTGNAFLMTLFARIVILAIAATSLNLILGYGGMVSFGHAVYLGIGGYPGRPPSPQGGTACLPAWAGGGPGSPLVPPAVGAARRLPRAGAITTA